MSEPTTDPIQDFWDGLAEFGPARTLAALDYALAALAGLVGAQQAYWLGSVRVSHGIDPIDGWRPAAIRYLHPQPALEAGFEVNCTLIEQGEIDPSILANVRHTGSYRINIQRRMVEPEWFESDFHHVFFAPFRIHDVLYLAMPLGEDIESWFGLQRTGPAAVPYEDADRERLDRAVRPLKWFHRRIALHHGLRITQKPLTPAERRVLDHLLGGATESSIAEALGLTQTTVHTYATRIYRKFNVQGRTGLAALWLGR